MSSSRLSFSSMRWRGRTSLDDPSRALSRGASSVRAGLRTTSIFETMDDPEEVVLWLRTLGMHQYIPQFRSHDVTGSTLRSLNSTELRNTLGITKLTDRRCILDAISYLAQTLDKHTKTCLPEDGRILTHLSNERIFLVWVRFSVLLNAGALATASLLPLTDKGHPTLRRVISAFLTALAVLSLLYGTFRYHAMTRLIESPGDQHLASKPLFMVPPFLVISAALVAIYAVMANNTQEAAAIVLLVV